MRVSELFPSRFIKYENLPEPIKRKIERIAVERVGLSHETRPVLHFVDEDRTLLLNKSNANTLRRAYGDETSNWVGREVELVPDEVEYRGTVTFTVRVVPQ